MKAREMLNKWPMLFLVWSLNEDTNVFYCDLSVLEENGDGLLLDPWEQRLNLKSAKRLTNASGDTVLEYRIETEYQGRPVSLSIVNE